jgi:uncharacterized protein YjbI with pentapeptide repeats
MTEDKGKQIAGQKEGRNPWTVREISGKTVWDWLQLFGVLAIPVVLAVGGCMFNAQQNTRQLQIEERRAEAERELAEQRAQDEQLQAYLDQMSTLLLEKDLSDDKVQTLIRARTLTVLARMDPGRKTQVMQFLDEANLLQRVDERDVAISLEDADLSGADLIEVRLLRANLTQADLSNAKLHFVSEASLVGANLTNADLAEVVGQVIQPHSHLRAADLSGADLTNANLIGADLSDAVLYSANLSEANLSGANLTDADLTNASVAPEQLARVASLKGATLPNGQKYEDWLKSKGSGEDGENGGPS